MRVFVATVAIMTQLVISLNATKNYTKEDLEALYQNQEWKEFLDHAKDIPPAQRKDAWKKMVQEASQKAIDNPNQFSDWPASRLTQEFPWLNSGTAKKGSLENLKNCYPNDYSGESCNKMALSMIESSGKDPATAFGIGQIIMTNQNAQFGMIAFQYALKNKQYCKDEAVKRSLVAAASAGNYQKAAVDLSLNTCWDEVREEFIQGLGSSESMKKLACPKLLERKLLTGLRKRACEKI